MYIERHPKHTVSLKNIPLPKSENKLKMQFKKNKIKPEFLAYILADIDGEITDCTGYLCTDCILNKKVPKGLISDTKEDTICNILYDLGEFIGGIGQEK